MVRLDEASLEDEESEFDELGYSKAHSSKTNNHQNQTNYIEEKEYDNLQYLEEFNAESDENVTGFTKMDFIKLNPIEKKCLGDLNKKKFYNYVTFSSYLNDEENFKTENTDEFIYQTDKLIDRINLLESNQIK